MTRHYFRGWFVPTHVINNSRTESEMSRKYRQQGYQDQDPSRSSRKRPARDPMLSEGPRSPRMPGMRTAVKCAMCGTKLPAALDEITTASKCSRCSADLHSCKNCVHFNPAERFECSQAISQRISPKDKTTNCEFFEIRTTVEKITTSTKESSPNDARAAFESLFK